MTAADPTVPDDAPAADTKEARAAARKATRRAIDRCRVCDDYGRLDDLSDCPHHNNFRSERLSEDGN